MKRDLKSNEGLVQEYMTFGSPLNQAFLMEAVIRYAKEVYEDREQLLEEEKRMEKEGKIPLVSYPAWIQCAKDWIDLYNDNREMKIKTD